MSKIDFKEYLKDCIKMVNECFEEECSWNEETGEEYDTPIDSKMALELKECSNYEHLADVMISWDFWEEDERYENLQYIK